MISGGTGKNELSANAIAPMVHIACGLCAASMHQSYKRRTGERGAAASTVMGYAVSRDGYGSAALANAPASDRHDLPRRRRLYHFFGQFFGDAEQHFAAAHF